MDDNYIHFELDGRKLKINKQNPDDVKMWKTHSGSQKLKNPRWNQLKIQTKRKGYKEFHIIPKKYLLHRINYYAHNPDWNIHDSSIDNFIDHEDIDCTNNNIENLRNISHQENLFNTNAKGYHWCERLQKWVAQIMVNGENKYLGLFILEVDARNAYLEAKKIYHDIK